MWKTNKMTGAAVALLLSAALAGCSDPGPTANAEEVDEAGLGAASVFAKPYLEVPSELALPPLGSAPPEGRTLVSLINPVPAAVTKNRATKEALTGAGWTFEGITVQGTPEGPRQALAAAIATKPDYIAYSGYTNEQMGPELGNAAAAGIPVIADGLTTSTVEPEIANAINTPAQVQLSARILAGYVIDQSGGKANIAMFDLSAYPILTAFVDEFDQALAEWCPACTMKVVDNQGTDIGTKVPQRVVSTLQADPDIDWVLFSLGDLANGVPAALKAAGLDDSVQVGGESPTSVQVAGLKDGSEDAWVGTSMYTQGYAVADVALRAATGDDLTGLPKALVPQQLMTQDNVADVPVDSEGNITGMADYAGLYRQVWNLG